MTCINSTYIGLLIPSKVLSPPKFILTISIVLLSLHKAKSFRQLRLFPENFSYQDIATSSCILHVNNETLREKIFVFFVVFNKPQKNQYVKAAFVLTLISKTAKVFPPL